MPDHHPQPACLACDPQIAKQLAADPALQAHWAALPRRQVRRGACLVQAGDALNASWFVAQGLARSVLRGADGTERNAGFFAEGDWIGFGLPPEPGASLVAVEALEPLHLVELPHAQLRHWQAVSPLAQQLLTSALHWSADRQAARLAELLLLDAGQRYDAFRAQQPALAARLPQLQLARYLGITDVALSRIRARRGLTRRRHSPVALNPDLG